MDVNCSICNTNFTKQYKNQKYCSKECRKQNKLKKTRIYLKSYSEKHVAECPNCKQQKPLICVNHTICHDCYNKKRYSEGNDKRKEQASVYNKKIKEIAISYYGEKKCFKCGITDLPACCYDFHHKDGNQKEFTIGSLPKSMTKLPLIKKEVESCVLLCANCHRIVHSKEYNSNGGF